jgi:hypothetical protein
MAPRGGADAGAPGGGASFPAWAKSVDAVEKHYGVTSAQGLSSQQVAAQRACWGFNELDKEEPTPLWKLVLEQFDDPLVKARRENRTERQRLHGGFVRLRAQRGAATAWRRPARSPRSRRLRTPAGTRTPRVRRR